jgi:hypothetical protein
VGNSTAATLTEIEQTRDRLERDMAELAERLPAPAIWLKRLAGVAVGGGVGGSLFWFVAHRIRNRSKKGKEEKTAKEAAAAVIAAPVVQVIRPSGASGWASCSKAASGRDLPSRWGVRGCCCAGWSCAASSDSPRRC